MKIKTTLFAGLCMLLLMGLSTYGDITIKGKEHQDGFMGQPATDTITEHYYGENHIRIKSDKSDMIFNMETGDVYAVDHEKQEYMLIDFDKMKEMTKQMKEMMGDMKVTVTDTGAKKEILGRECTEYVMAMDSSMMKMEMHMWNDTSIDLDKAKLEAYFRKMAMIQGMEDFMDEFLKMKGVTLAQERTMTVMGSEIAGSFTATEVLTDKIPVEVFKIPSEYKKVEFNPMALKQQ